MDPELASVLKAAFYSASAFGSIYSIARFSFQRRKSDNETYAARTEAEIRKAEKVKELLADPNYQKYLETRREVGERLASETPELLEHSFAQDNFERTLDIIIGNYVFK